MKTISKFLFFNKGFMDHFTTTVYPKIYVPSTSWWEDDDKFAFSTLAHEYVHLKDRKRLGYIFNFLYLFPQNLTFLTAGALWNPWCLLFLLFLLPFPSPGRAWLEYRGYMMTIACYFWLESDEFFSYHTTRGWVVSQFTSSNYYWMFPFPKLLQKIFDRGFKNIVEGGKLTRELKQIKEIINAV